MAVTESLRNEHPGQQIFGPDLVQQISPSLVLLQRSPEYRARRSVKTRTGKRDRTWKSVEQNGTLLIVFPQNRQNLILQEMMLLDIDFVIDQATKPSIIIDGSVIQAAKVRKAKAATPSDLNPQYINDTIKVNLQGEARK
ncbi:hypothetical protein N0V85_004210 [Neurospora sp. IMI 360204]|nr:hypothetical protein N0V85_004210 [Neurospora sp. IMI 360204]